MSNGHFGHHGNVNGEMFIWWTESTGNSLKLVNASQLQWRQSKANFLSCRPSVPQSLHQKPSSSAGLGTKFPILDSAHTDLFSLAVKFAICIRPHLPSARFMFRSVSFRNCRLDLLRSTCSALDAWRPHARLLALRRRSERTLHRDGTNDAPCVKLASLKARSPWLIKVFVFTPCLRIPSPSTHTLHKPDTSEIHFLEVVLSH